MWQSTSDYLTYINTGGDERTFPYILTKPWQSVCMSFAYVLLVTVIGPKFMKNRKPYNLKNTLIVYNIIQIILSAYVFIEALDMWSDVRKWFRCRPTPMGNDSVTLRIIFGHYVYYMNKYLQFFDTIFFVMRKKFKQVSFLHVYHHSSMPILTCFSFRFAPAGSITFIGYVNSIVHIIMYGYYLFAALGPRFQKYLTWKKYLTKLQLIQFVILFIHYVIVAFSGEECNFPKFLLVFTCISIMINLVLFWLFYKKSYKPKNKKTNGEIDGCIPVRRNIKSS